jgi:isoamylase
MLAPAAARGYFFQVRNFIKGMDGWAGPFASAICGSPDVYVQKQAAETDW